MSRSTRTVIGRVAAIAGIGALAVLGSATAAYASQGAGGTVSPGGQLCTATQYASFQVRGIGTATGQLPAGGAKFKLLRNGVVVANTPARANQALFESRTAYGNFPGAGNYQLCANNTGAAPTQVTLTLTTDSELN